MRFAIPCCLVPEAPDLIWTMQYMKKGIVDPSWCLVSRAEPFTILEMLGTRKSIDVGHYLDSKKEAPHIIANAGSDYLWPDSYAVTKVVAAYRNQRDVYAQNIKRKFLSPELRRRSFWLPIGFEFHSETPPWTLSDTFANKVNRHKRQIMQIASLDIPKIPRMLVTFTGQYGLHHNHHSRGGILRQAMSTGNADMFIGPRDDYWRMLRKYLFVVCPRGNGWATHRFWEALLMGCIPIVEQDSVLRADIEAAGLPVEFVASFRLTSKDLAAIASKHVPLKPDDPRLTFNYYLDPDTRVCSSLTDESAPRA